jgi:inosose dehydratase
VTDRNVRLGAELIAFFDSEYWGMPAKMPFPEFVTAFKEKPRERYDRMLDEASAAGAEGVELPPDPGGWTTALAAYGDVAGVKAALEQRGLAVGSSYESSWDFVVPALDDPAFEKTADERYAAHARFLAELGAGTIVSGTMARARFAGGFHGEVPREDMERVAAQYNRLGAVVKPYGVRIAIHTDSFSICSRPQDIDAFLSLTDPETVQLCPDAGHITLDGGDAADILAAHVDRVPVMHWKDCTGRLDPATLSGTVMEQHETQMTYFRVMGEGIVDWRRWQATLRDSGWRGWAMSETDMAKDPRGDLEKAYAFYRAELEPIYR